ncbi:hypothetical protein ACFLTQ_00945 [Chloroflexota bacterium]
MGLVFGWARNILAIVGLFTIIMVIILGVCICQLTGSPALEGKMDKFELTEAQFTSLANDFDDKVENLQEIVADKSYNPGDAMKISFTEEEVTAKLLDEIENSDIPLDISGIWVNFAYDEDDERYEVWILSKVDIGLGLTAGLEFLVEVENGKPKIIPEGDGLGLDIGGGSVLPEEAKQQIANALPIEETLTDMFNNLPIYITEIEISDGEITFTGTFEQ